jgi:hypothetical protein
MVAAAINADTRWFWHGPDAWRGAREEEVATAALVPVGQSQHASLKIGFTRATGGSSGLTMPAR